MIRVLLVDDQPLFREGLAFLLSQQDDFDVVGEASDGKEAISLCHKLQPDVVLMDMRMPGMDGIEATRRIRNLGLRVSQPWIVAMTANAISEDRQRCLSAGMNDYLSKPIRRETLSQVLSQV